MRTALSIVFSLGFFLALAQEESFFSDFPDYFDYEFRPGVRTTWNKDWNNYDLIDQETDMQVGCRNPVDVRIAFSLLFRQPFLHETYPRHYDDVESHPGTPKNIFYIMYGVKKDEYFAREKTLNALAEYCIYGQINFVHETEEYLLFMMHYAINSEGLMRGLNKLGLQTDFLNALDDALRGDIPMAKVVDYRHSNLEAPYRLQDFKGSYIMYAREETDLRYSLAMEEVSPRKLTISKWSQGTQGKGKVISNYNQNRSNWYIDKAEIWIDKNLLFIEVEGWGLKVYRIEKKGSLLNLEHGYRYIQIPEE